VCSIARRARATSFGSNRRTSRNKLEELPLVSGFSRFRGGQEAPIVTSAQNETLRNLLDASGKGDAQAFARLYRQSSAKLFGVAVRIVRREDWAEEIVQESYVNIWNHAADYRMQLSAPLTWMSSIVRNRCLDWLRRPSFEVPEDDDTPLDSWASADPGPLADLERANDAQAIAKCLGRLEAKMRQAIMLAFFQGFSHTELAEHMQEPLGTVKTWVRRGLDRLRGCLSA
jgi:RNA polymerase sigma-70 factor (ECF subfamily)